MTVTECARMHAHMHDKHTTDIIFNDENLKAFPLGSGTSPDVIRLTRLALEVYR